MVASIGKPIQTEVVEDGGITRFAGISFFHVKADGTVGQDAGGRIGGTIRHEDLAHGPGFAFVVTDVHRHVLAFGTVWHGMQQSIFIKTLIDRRITNDITIAGRCYKVVPSGGIGLPRHAAVFGNIVSATIFVPNAHQDSAINQFHHLGFVAAHRSTSGALPRIAVIVRIYDVIIE